MSLGFLRGSTTWYNCSLGNVKYIIFLHVDVIVHVLYMNVMILLCLVVNVALSGYVLKAYIDCLSDEQTCYVWLKVKGFKGRVKWGFLDVVLVRSRVSVCDEVCLHGFHLWEKYGFSSK